MHDVAVVRVEPIDFEERLVGEIHLARALVDIAEVVQQDDRLDFLDVRPHGFVRVAVCVPEGRVGDPVFNAAASLIVAGKAKDLKEGAALAAKSLDSGEAEGRLERLIKVSNAT